MASKKNWDQIVRDFEEEEKQSKTADDLFREIYQSGSDEVRRAMVKSFTESAGTVLSTNWAEIGSKKTEVKPPDGVLFKKWNDG